MALDHSDSVPKGPVTQAQTQGLRKDRELIPTFEFYAIAGFERFKTLLRIQIDMFLTRINVQLTPFLCDPYVIRAQIACHVQPRTTDPNRVKLAQKPEFVCDQYVIRALGLCDRALTSWGPALWS